MSITYIEMPLEATSLDREGVLILWQSRLAAVVSRLSDCIHGDAQGQWFLEAGFGRCAQQMKPFASLNAAALWVEALLTTCDATAVLEVPAPFNSTDAMVVASMPDPGEAIFSEYRRSAMELKVNSQRARAGRPGRGWARFRSAAASMVISQRSCLRMLRTTRQTTHPSVVAQALFSLRADLRRVPKDIQKSPSCDVELSIAGPPTFQVARA